MTFASSLIGGQGQESLVTIISTVASEANLTGHGIGFMNNPRRFNVAVSRAKVICNEARLWTVMTV